MKIAVIGGGVSGSLVTINLLKKAAVPLTVYLFEKNPGQLNKGVAYSSQLPYQLLNVPVKDMSLFIESKQEFELNKGNAERCKLVVSSSLSALAIAKVD